MRRIWGRDHLEGYAVVLNGDVMYVSMREDSAQEFLDLFEAHWPEDSEGPLLQASVERVTLKALLSCAR